MKNIENKMKTKRTDPIPDEFSSYEEAAEFWDTHDTADYPENFTTVEAEVKLMERHYEVGIEEDIMETLMKRSKETNIPVQRLVSKILRERLAATK